MQYRKFYCNFIKFLNRDEGFELRYFEWHVMPRDFTSGFEPVCPEHYFWLYSAQNHLKFTTIIHSNFTACCFFLFIKSLLLKENKTFVKHLQSGKYEFHSRQLNKL